jgi:hypothetical protein
MPVLDVSGRWSSAARSECGAATTWPVQFMISAVSSPPGVPSARSRRIDLPSLTGRVSPAHHLVHVIPVPSGAFRARCE